MAPKKDKDGSEQQQEQGSFTKEHADLIRRTVCPKGIGEDEFALFIEQCKRSGLDPLLKEAFCVGRRANTGTKERPNWTTKYEFQPSETGMLVRAERFPDYEGISASAVYAEDEISLDMGTGTVHHRFNPAKRKGSLAGAWARVGRRGKDPVVVWLDFAGYVQQTPLWSKIPTTMIEKCARVAALRKAYPEAFGGLYVREELPAEELVDDAPRAPGLPVCARCHRERASGSVPRPDLCGGCLQLLTKEVEDTKAQLAAKEQGKAAAPLERDTPSPEAVAAGKGQPLTQEQRAQAGAVAGVLGALVAAGPHKGRTIRELSNDELNESIELADEKLAEQPKAKWAAAVKANRELLAAEWERRMAVAEPDLSNEPGSEG